MIPPRVVLPSVFPPTVVPPTVSILKITERSLTIDPPMTVVIVTGVPRIVVPPTTVPPIAVPPITVPLTVVPPTVVAAIVVPPTVVPPTTVTITVDPADSIGGAPGTPAGMLLVSAGGAGMPVIGDDAGIGLTGGEGPNERDDTTEGSEIMRDDTDGFGLDTDLEAIWVLVGGANIAVDDVPGGTDVGPAPVEGRIVLLEAAVVVTAGILMIFVVVKIITGDA